MAHVERHQLGEGFPSKRNDPVDFFRPELLPLRDFRKVRQRRARVRSHSLAHRVIISPIGTSINFNRLLASDRTSVELPSEVFTREVPSGIR